RLRIYHPYGTVGHLPWQKKQPSVEFGGYEDRDDLVAVSEQIKTFTERIDDQNFLAGMKDCISSAKKMAFLGFAFHEQNMELLRLSNKANVDSVYATTLARSDSDKQIIKSLINSCLKRNTTTHELVDSECAVLFDQFSLTLPAR